MRRVDIFGTLGPACARQDILEEMFACGMTGMRLNLSHTGLESCEEWIRNFRQAAVATNVEPKLLIDLQGPELRIGEFESQNLIEGTEVVLGKGGIPVPDILLQRLCAGQQVLLDDGKLLLEVADIQTNAEVPNVGTQCNKQTKEIGNEEESRIVSCRVLRGGMLKPRKSISPLGMELPIPTLTESDLKNLAVAKKYGVTGVMLPFVRNEEDLKALRTALEEVGASDIKIYAKIENMAGVNMLEKLLPYADEIVIARGDLGNAMPLWELPAVQHHIGTVCANAGKSYMVVTQMLASMEHAAVPTRAEVSDIFYAVLHGASSVMLTRETAAGEYPVEAMRYMCETVKVANDSLS